MQKLRKLPRYPLHIPEHTRPLSDGFRQLKISRDTVNEKFAFIKAKGFGYDTLLKMDDSE